MYYLYVCKESYEQSGSVVVNKVSEIFSKSSSFGFFLCKSRTSKISISVSCLPSSYRGNNFFFSK